MIDINYIKNNPEEVIARLAKKGKDARQEIEQILQLDAERRALIVEGEAIKAEQNKINKQIPQLKKQGADVAPIFAQMKEMGARVRERRLLRFSTRVCCCACPTCPMRIFCPAARRTTSPFATTASPEPLILSPRTT